jgi:hypothetical protein
LAGTGEGFHSSKIMLDRKPHVPISSSKVATTHGGGRRGEVIDVRP